MGLPKGWDADAHKEWEAGRRAEAIGRILTMLHNARPATAEMALQAGYYLFIIGDLPLARQILEAVRATNPDHLELLMNLAVIYDRLKANAEARATLEHYVALGGKDPNAFDGLCAACHRTGDDDSAREWGRRSIEEKTMLAARSAPELTLGKPREQGAKVIAFSLWGPNPRYLRGALHNCVRAGLVYPGFRCRFYVDASVPADLLDALSAQSAELVVEDGEPSQRRKLTRRFLAADDPAVAVYLVRDCDSLVNAREAAAVGEWLDSGKAIHVMRDWWTHTDPMLAGMWGGLGGVLPPLEPMIESYKAGVLETPNWDQWFLRDRIWPGVRDVALVHDRLFTTEGARPFPGRAPAGNLHVGQNEFVVRGEQQARELAPFKAKVPSLQL
ncbi:MAG TPA: tetratricopeptide repeat protein [Sphingomicrobium sp.]|nr:tetratricopeptide repeat protein [Sphingomicrobium sp.]